MQLKLYYVYSGVKFMFSLAIIILLRASAFSVSQVCLATVVFVASQTSLSTEIKAVIRPQLEASANGWTVYRIARQASRMVSKF